MTEPRYSIFHSLIQKVIATRWGAWLGARIVHHFDRLAFKLTGGHTTISPMLAGLPVAMVTTLGAKSGLQRTLPLLFVRDERNPDSLAVIASNWGQPHYPAWYFNLKAHPQATCSIDGQARVYVTHEASGDEYDRFWQIFVEVYKGYLLYKKWAVTRKIPIIVMEPAK